MKAKLRLAGASYDMAWAKEEKLILIAGGGGTGNTGVKNQIQVVAANKDKAGEYTLVSQYVTDHDGHQRFCCGVSSGQWGDVSLVGVALGDHCLLLSLSLQQTSQQTTFTRLAEFAADFAEKDAGVNCCCILTPSSDIATGGEDGIVRLWRLTRSTAVTLLSENSVSVTSTFECRGHAGPIMALGRHPTQPWVSSASKDGSCKIWDTKTGKMLADIPPVSNDGADSSSKTKAASLTKMQCRGCCFSSDGKLLYTIQCGRIGSTVLIQYSLSRDESGDNLIAVPKKTAIANKNPSTRLVISESGEHLAVGCSSGLVSVFHVSTNGKLAKINSAPCHDDQPVLGLAFAPSAVADAAGAKCVVFTCSVDSLMTSTVISSSSHLVRYLLLLLLLAVFAAFYYTNSH